MKGKFWTWRKWCIVGISGGNIRDGNKIYIIAVVWQTMSDGSLQVMGNKTEEELISLGNDRWWFKS